MPYRTGTKTGMLVHMGVSESQSVEDTRRAHVHYRSKSLVRNVRGIGRDYSVTIQRKSICSLPLETWLSTVKRF